MDKEGIKTMACQCCALVASVRDLIGHLRHLWQNIVKLSVKFYNVLRVKNTYVLLINYNSYSKKMPK